MLVGLGQPVPTADGAVHCRVKYQVLFIRDSGEGTQQLIDNLEAVREKRTDEYTCSSMLLINAPVMSEMVS